MKILQFNFFLIIVMYMSVTPLSKEDNKITGAWKSISGSEKAVIIMEDGYLTLTKYDTASNKFLITKAESIRLGTGLLTVNCDFNSTDKNEVVFIAEARQTVHKLLFRPR